MAKITINECVHEIMVAAHDGEPMLTGSWVLVGEFLGADGEEMRTTICGDQTAEMTLDLLIRAGIEQHLRMYGET